MLSVCFLIIIAVSFCDSTNNCTAPNTLITFDNLPVTGNQGALISANYYNLTWSNAYYFTSANLPSSGYPTALSSGQNIVFNSYGNPMSITSTSTNGPFSISSFIASSAWNDNLQLAIVGRLNGTTVYNGSIILQVTSASLVTLNWLNIDTIFFTTSGGTTHAMVTGSGEEFAMDNLCINLNSFITTTQSPPSSTTPSSGGSGPGSGSNGGDMGPDDKPDGPKIPVGGIVAIVVVVVFIVAVVVWCVYPKGGGC